MPPTPPPMKKKKLGPLPPEVRRRVVEDTSDDEEEVYQLLDDRSTVETDVDDEAEIADIQSEIRSLLKLSTFEPKQRYWLDTGNTDLNAALGSRKYGLPYGKIYELAGIEHGGKTALTTVIAGMAQQDGAAVGYLDLEDSRDSAWATKLGLDFSKVLPIWPKLLVNKPKKVREGADADALKPKLKGKKKKVVKDIQLQSAEQLFEEVEAGFAAFSRHGYTKQFWILDSIANLQTAMAVDAGTTDWNMRVNADRAMFLSRALPRWAGLCASYNVMLFCINQLRTKLGIVFGNPEYSPGGRALAHACAIRARVRRVKNGQVKQNGKTVGIVGTVTNTKNKAGKGSEEGHAAAFKIRWDKSPARVTFMSKEDAED